MAARRTCFADFAALPDHVAITYINCSAEVKALTDIICTSSNAEKIIRQIPPDKPILFAPDQHLGAYLMKKTGREMRLWPGSCIVHEMFSEKSLVQLKERHPSALDAGASGMSRKQCFAMRIISAQPPEF